MKCTEHDYETLVVTEPDPGLAVVTLNRPERYNAMTNTMFDELEHAARTLDRDPHCLAVVVTGAGKAFCAGYDLDDAGELAGLGALGMLDQQERAARAMVALRTMRPPMIAAVNGPAAGGGFALALAADIRVAAPEAKFNAAFVKIGLTAGDLGTSWLLTRLIGPAATSDICFTGRMVLAEEAERLGVVNEVSASGAALDASVAKARAILSNSPGGVRLSKTAIRSNLEISSYAAALELENRGQALMTRTEDMPEALSAFREGRAPTFRGR